ncbi:NUDIX domain-containing protein [Lachnospiraceae bacterium OttesenSCG-928-E19]|nr:NUDIX domain-containing protein [Lachnospiraceae bacterium OttesenSCG-928-E19]
MRLNLVPIFNQDFTQVLMCIRAKDPFKGMYNFVGGKVDGDESDILAAYRELSRDAGIAPGDVQLYHFMNMYFAVDDYELIVFVGKLSHDKELIEEKNKLVWVDLDENFFDVNKYAGNGNIGLIIAEIKKSREQLFG